jgi:hypothetical protein
VKIRFYIDPELGAPHICGHLVNEEEVNQVMSRPWEDRSGRDGSRVAIGQTHAGRFLRVVYVPDANLDSIFVVTAYELSDNAKHALRRRRRRKA